MGKKTKEHRAKVAKRNQRISEEKMKMQRTFNKLLKEQMDKFKETEELKVQMGNNPVEFNIVDPNDMEPNSNDFSMNDVENVIDVDTVGEFTTVKESLISEDEEQ